MDDGGEKSESSDYGTREHEERGGREREQLDKE